MHYFFMHCSLAIRAEPVPRNPALKTARHRRKPRLANRLPASRQSRALPSPARATLLQQWAQLRACQSRSACHPDRETPRAAPLTACAGSAAQPRSDRRLPRSASSLSARPDRSHRPQRCTPLPRRPRYTRLGSASRYPTAPPLASYVLLLASASSNVVCDTRPALVLRAQGRVTGVGVPVTGEGVIYGAIAVAVMITDCVCVA